MVKSKTQDHRNDTSEASDHGSFVFLRHAIASPERLRKDLFLGLTYNILYSLLTNLISGIFSSLLWKLICHMIVGLLLCNFHLRWTCAILAIKRPAHTRIISLPRRGLIVPALMYGLAYRLTVRLPVYIAKLASLQHEGKLEGIAFADSVVVTAAFGLRMLVLYPAFAAYIYSEIKQVQEGDTAGSNSSEGQEKSPGLGLGAYGKAVWLCFERTAAWFGLLHLQMVVVLAMFEILMTPIVYKVVF